MRCVSLWILGPTRAMRCQQACTRIRLNRLFRRVEHLCTVRFAWKPPRWEYALERKTCSKRVHGYPGGGSDFGERVTRPRCSNVGVLCNTRDGYWEKHSNISA